MIVFVFGALLDVYQRPILAGDAGKWEPFFAWPTYCTVQYVLFHSGLRKCRTSVIRTYSTYSTTDVGSHIAGLNGAETGALYDTNVLHFCSILLSL